MNFNFNVGDTNFLALVNTSKYTTYVNIDWNLLMLKNHFIKETEKGNILIMQMTDEGIESDWRIRISFEENTLESNYFRKESGYINVDNKELCFVEYTCLTMAAQFEDEIVPDTYCDKFRFNIENGLYKVDVIQYYDIDNDKHYGRNDIDIEFKFTKVLKCEEMEHKVFWWNI